MKEVIIDGIVYVPKEAVKEDSSTPPFKVGDWRITEGGRTKFLFHVTAVDGDADGKIYFDMCSHGTQDDWAWRGSEFGTARLATPEEIKTYLIAEAERRGYKGVLLIKGLYANSTPHHLSERITVGHLSYDENEDSLDVAEEGIRVYCKGKWAKIVKEPRPLPKTVEELEALLVGCVWAYMQDTEESEDVFVSKFVEEFR